MADRDEPSLESSSSPLRGEFDATEETRGDDSASVPPARARMHDRLMHAAVARSLLGITAETEAPSASAVAVKVGRFVVVDRIGAGGMGTVYLAYDPELDRRVALKVLLPRPDAAGHEERMRREALALARLTHPNVVTIYEVGTSGGELFLAMEYVAGRDLATWAREHPVGSTKRFAEASRLLRQAGLGLAAAHDAGLVHRDFKPSNVLVGDDGRVRVADFGLVRAHDDVSAPETMSDGADPPVDATLTKTGAMLGTPRYMPPEQQLGRPVDARSDQFAYCLTAWEVLFGDKPWPGLLPDPDTPAVPPSWAPRWLRRVFEKGLAPRPEDRFADMRQLLAALQRGRARARFRVAAIAVGAIALVGLGAGAYGRWDRARAIAACEREGASIEEVWNSTRRGELRDAMLATGLGYAEVSAEKVMPWLDDHARAWAAAQTEACMHAVVEQTWDAESYDRAAWCLEERRFEVAALLDALARGEDAAVRASVAAAARLGDVDTCLDPDALLPAPPAETREAVRAVKETLSRANALSNIGDYAAALEEARVALAQAEPLAWMPLLSECRMYVGSLLGRLGRIPEAEQELHAAYFAAVEAGAPSLAVAAADELAGTVGEAGGRHAEALLWTRHSEVARKQLGDPTGLRLAASLYEIGTIHYDKGDFAAARESHGRALEIRDEVLGPEHPDVANSLHNVALLDAAAGDYEAAIARMQRAVAIWRAALGPGHPHVGTGLTAEANLRQEAGQYAEAHALYFEALEIRRRAFPGDSIEVAETLHNLGALEWTMGRDRDAIEHANEAAAMFERLLGAEHHFVGVALVGLATMHYSAKDFDEARVVAERALLNMERALGPDHPDLPPTLGILGAVYQATGDLAGARVLFERALAIRERTHGAVHPDLTQVLVDLASVSRAAGDHAEALALSERALAIVEGAFGPEHPGVAEVLVERAEALLARGDAAAAVSAAERALRVREASAVASDEVARTRFLLARASWTAGEDRAAALAQARRALDVYREGARTAREAEEIEAWLRTRSVSAP